MDYEKKSLAELKEIAKEKGIKKISSMKKQEVIDALKAFDSAAKAAEVSKSEATPVEAVKSPSDNQKSRVHNVEKIVNE